MSRSTRGRGKHHHGDASVANEDQAGPAQPLAVAPQVPAAVEGSIAPPTSPAAPPADATPSKRTCNATVDAIVDPVISVLPARVQPYAQQAVTAAKPFVEQGVETAKPYVLQAVETAKPYTDAAVAKAEPIFTATKETVHTVSTKTTEFVETTKLQVVHRKEEVVQYSKDTAQYAVDRATESAQPFVKLVLPIVDATVEHAAKARAKTTEVFDTTKERVHESAEAFASAKAQAAVKKDEYVEFGKGAFFSYFDRMAQYVQPYVDISKKRFTYLRSAQQDAVSATKEFVAAKKTEVVQLSKESAQSAVDAAKAKAQPLVDKAQPIVSNVVGKATETYDRATLHTSTAKQSASTFVSTQCQHFQSKKKQVMDVLVPEEAQQRAAEKWSQSRLLYFASLSFTASLNVSFFLMSKIAETDHAQALARRWEEKKSSVQNDSRFKRLTGFAVPFTETCLSVVGRLARKSTDVFAFVGKPTSCVGST